jgi:hypothetical protein
MGENTQMREHRKSIDTSAGGKYEVRIEERVKAEEYTG